MDRRSARAFRALRPPPRLGLPSRRIRVAGLLMTPIRGRAGRSALGGGAADTLRTEKAGRSCGAGPRGWSRLLGSSTPTREICNLPSYLPIGGTLKFPHPHHATGTARPARPSARTTRENYRIYDVGIKEWALRSRWPRAHTRPQATHPASSCTEVHTNTPPSLSLLNIAKVDATAACTCLDGSRWPSNSGRTAQSRPRSAP